jgi:hypothetical protein
MSEPVNETGGDQVIDQGFSYLKDQQEPPAPVQQTQQEEIKLNPAWDNLLKSVPQQYHQAILPELKTWDQNYDSGLQKVHSQYEGWKPFIENQVSPEEVNNALLVWQSMNDNPDQFIRTIMDYYKFSPDGGQGQNPQPQDETDDDGVPFDITQHPEFQRYSQMTELMGQQLLAQHEQQVAAEVENEVAQMFTDAQQRLGDFDEAYVAQLMMVNEGMDIDTAVQIQRERDQQLIQNYRSPGQNAPVLMGGGGGLPSQQTKVSGLSDQQRRALIVQHLTNMENS